MLKLLIFAPCEKLIIGQDDGASLISVVEGLDVSTTEPIPIDARIPMKWAVVTLWRRESDVENSIAFEQKVEVIRPDGERLGGGFNAFKVHNEHWNFRNTIEFHDFPIGVAGDLILKLFLREAGKGNEWREFAEFPIKITFKLMEQTDKESATENTEV